MSGGMSVRPSVRWSVYQSSMYVLFKQNVCNQNIFNLLTCGKKCIINTILVVPADEHMTDMSTTTIIIIVHQEFQEFLRIKKKKY